MVSIQLAIFVFLCIIMGILEFLCDASKEKVKSVILLMIVLINIVIAIILNNKVSYVFIGMNFIICFGYIISIGLKLNKKGL